MHVIFRNRYLEDGRTLGYSGVEEGEAVSVVPRARATAGGRCCNQIDVEKGGRAEMLRLLSLLGTNPQILLVKRDLENCFTGGIYLHFQSSLPTSTISAKTLYSMTTPTPLPPAVSTSLRASTPPAIGLAL